MRLRLFALAGFVLLASPAFAATDDLASLNAQIVNDPGNVEFNLRYARRAEELGKLDNALTAYERALIYDPGNAEAQAGLRRMNARVQPTVTQINTEFGIGWESNPHDVPFGHGADAVFFGRVSLRDERTVADTRWRTTGLLVGNAYKDSGDLNYGYAAAAIGPVYSTSETWTVHPAVGAGAAYFDHHFFYSEAFTSLLFEGSAAGMTQIWRFRGGYRDYDDFFPATRGFFADAVAKFARGGILFENDLAIFSPWVRWSGIGGTFFVTSPLTSLAPDEIQPGRYWEYGTRLEYFRPLTEWLIVGANFAWSERDYAKSLDALGAGFNRRDRIYSPGGSMILRNVLPYRGDIRFDYRYERDDSNNALSSYTNHIFTVIFANRY